VSFRKKATLWLISAKIHITQSFHYITIPCFSKALSCMLERISPLFSMADTETIFHKIRDKKIPATIVFEDDEVLGFLDIHPKAPTHVLFIPKQFVASIADIDTPTAHLPGLLILTAQAFAKEHSITGYKLTFHVGEDGGQEVPYLHLHFLSQQVMK
jgi:diadenosine tetraphosphate (Ap4A) HIT family hydrolase